LLSFVVVRGLTLSSGPDWSKDRDIQRSIPSSREHRHSLDRLRPSGAAANLTDPGLTGGFDLTVDPDQTADPDLTDPRSASNFTVDPDQIDPRSASNLTADPDLTDPRSASNFTVDPDQIDPRSASNLTADPELSGSSSASNLTADPELSDPRSASNLTDPTMVEASCFLVLTWVHVVALLDPPPPVPLAFITVSLSLLPDLLNGPAQMLEQ
jgi:hypothetical protein